MLSTVYSGAVYGVDAYCVEIEVNAGHGDPQVVIVGLPDTAVKESKDRVRTAIHNSGFRTHAGRTTINLAPADIKKEGPLFDLPIAIGMLLAQEEVKSSLVDFMEASSKPATGTTFTSVIGVMDSYSDKFSLLPRKAADLVK